MFNPYILILALFAVGGVATMVYGWMNLTRARKRASWPRTQGTINSHTPASASPDLQAYLTLDYEVDGNALQTTISVTPDIAHVLENQFDAGNVLTLQYDPLYPEQAQYATTKVGSEWLVIAVGAAATLFGALAILFNL